MCRFNLILTKEEGAEKLLIQEDFRKFYDDLGGFNAYQKGYCNCGSLVGSFADQKGIPYQVAIDEAKKKKVERQNKIRILMNQPDYEERKERFLQTSTSYSEQIEIFYKPIQDYELEQTNYIHTKYSGEEFQQHYEKLHLELQDMFVQIESQPEYSEFINKFREYSKENELLQESLLYCLTAEESNQTSKGIPLKELLGLEDDLEAEEFATVNIPMESNVIDDVINRTECDTNAEHLEEYQTYYELFMNLLEVVPSILFGTIWSEANEMKLVKTVKINSLLIDDLAILDYNDMICITQ
ncbi:MAG: hypothetical protein K0R34_749 [Herbinix sp.]|nr:hypothetical protein [Herbinix sp.]